MSDRSRSRDVGFRVIGTMKLASGLAALAFGLGILHVFGHDPGPRLERAVSHLGLDPHNDIIHSVISRLTGIDRTRLRTVEAGTFLYALLHLIEGIGLILERDWAGYLVVIVSSSLIPFEIYEILKNTNALRITLLIVNVAIVIYLIANLRKKPFTTANRTA